MKTFPSHRKLRGEWAEWQFIARAFAQGFRVAKPLGDCCRYDVLIDNPTGFHRVQIKSTTRLVGPSYKCLCMSSVAGNRIYSEDDFDFVAAYVVQADCWFIIPVMALTKKHAVTRGMLSLDPLGRCPRNRFHPYREAWHLLREPGRLTVHAAAERFPPSFVWVKPPGQVA